jgi:hypothetical protein
MTKGKGRRYRSTTPDPAPLADALRGVFTKLAESITAKLGKAQDIGVRTKSWFPMGDWTDAMKQALTPVVKAYMSSGMDAVFAELGGDPSVGRHAVQELDQAVDHAVLALANSTLSTTQLSVTDAVEATREAIRQGLDHGEADAQLATRIKDVFH